MRESYKASFWKTKKKLYRQGKTSEFIAYENVMILNARHHARWVSEWQYLNSPEHIQDSGVSANTTPVGTLRSTPQAKINLLQEAPQSGQL